jgi:hypothetical protein
MTSFNDIAFIPASNWWPAIGNQALRMLHNVSFYERLASMDWRACREPVRLQGG